MAGFSAVTPSALSIYPEPKIGSKPDPFCYKIRASSYGNFSPFRLRLAINISDGRNGLTKLNAGLSEIEPDLSEEKRDPQATNGIHEDDFLYGIYDGHHTYYEAEDKSTFWESLKEEFESAGPPTGFQGLISWLFLPSVALGMYLNVPGEYLYIGAAIFTIVFWIIELDKPSEPHNFEPEIYNMERGARDKLIAEYNSMDIWDFNEKYGDLWDFTVTKDADEIMKR